ncbi:MAG: hypothetical protein L0332_24495, partial [Chloroflexi bacterium]|nr:hypothetical protein [Chloroflexota bacterium]
MMKSRSLLFMLLATVSLLLAGCRIVVATQVNADGSGERRTDIIYTAEEVASFTQTPGNEGRSVCDQIN